MKDTKGTNFNIIKTESTIFYVSKNDTMTWDNTPKNNTIVNNMVASLLNDSPKEWSKWNESHTIELDEVIKRIL